MNKRQLKLGYSLQSAEADIVGVEAVSTAVCLLGTDKEFPDLVIEVIVTSGSINKLELYRIPSNDKILVAR